MANQIPNNFTFDDDLTAKITLELEAKKLYDIAKRVWLRYYNNYTPQVYDRTGKTIDALKIGSIRKIDAFTWGIDVFFENNLVYHESRWGKKYPDAHTVMIIGGWSKNKRKPKTGWRVKRGWHKDIHRFGYFEGFDYLGEVEREYNKIRDQRIFLDIQWTGKTLK